MSSIAYEHDGAEENRLMEVFGLTESAIEDVIFQGFQARTECTSNHPKTYPGLVQWAETVRALRDKTAPLGWTKTDDNNFPLCVHPTSNLAIVVQTGDQETGTSGIPSNRAPKGANTVDAVAVNYRQLSLFDGLPDFDQTEDTDKQIMWVLLYHVAPTEIRYELSLPMQMIGGKIRGWQDRIVFPAIQIGHTDIDIGDDDGTEFDVPVERLPK